MASQPSVCNERNLLRLRAREQRSQETSQAKEFSPENVPLFPEPYKTNKGDELSNRIRRMLGSYDDVNTCSISMEAFPIPSCQPGITMTQKPTAYVRPMDGQDQVVSESPQLKQSPERYSPLPELIIKSDLDKIKKVPPSLAVTEEGLSVEDILREMTQPLPPLLSSIQTPYSLLSKLPLSAKVRQRRSKELDQVSSHSEQKHHHSSSIDPPQLIQEQPCSVSFEALRSSGVETTSSSDSECSPASESDSESTTEESAQQTKNSSVAAGPEPPGASLTNWQLGNWIRSSQQNSSSEGHGDPLVSQSPSHNLLSQNSRNKIEELSSHHKEFPDNPVVRCHESLQNNRCRPQSSKNSLPGSSRNCKTSKKHSIQARFLDHAAATSDAKSVDVLNTQTKDSCFTGKPNVKTKLGCSKKDSSGSKRDKKRTKHSKKDEQKSGLDVPLVVTSHCISCGGLNPNSCSCFSQNPDQNHNLLPVPPIQSKPKTEICQSGTKLPHKSLLHEKTSPWDAVEHPPKSLLVKIDLHLLSRTPQTVSSHGGISTNMKRPALVIEREESSAISKVPKDNRSCKKLQKAGEETKSLPKKRLKAEKKLTSSVKLESFKNLTEIQKQKLKKLHEPATSKEPPEVLKLGSKSFHKLHKSSTESGKKKLKKSSKEDAQHLHHDKKPTKKSTAGSLGSPRHKETLTKRPLLRLDIRQHPVDHYIKEAKRLKHKADAETDKVSKALNYMEAAMFFVESGIAMEKVPHISMSSYTMFAETVELLKYVVKLKNPVDASTPPSEIDFLVLCMKCQCLLQMAMFRHKQKTAVKFSKTLSEYFQSFAQASHISPACSLKITENPSSSTPSPASSASGGLGVGSSGATVTVPQEIEQVTFTYINITALFLTAQDMWEQAEELAHKGSGLLAELDTAMGPLTITSNMNSMVRYTRQGVHWLRLDS
ncbi:AF4/FMR2 family member 4 isoform X3 [Oryzias melastigma]|uniref:AF4/FMR2 family member 4 isoform X3 n=1 Tax=Oryzias melastigma TaxID=30732 RepID=UPI000CF83FB9|nr:AF4/FMR2 family member 4 isoform X3 [Oryzias melastigma]